MKFTKEIARPGKYVVNVPRKQQDGSVKMVREEKQITKDQIASWESNFLKMREKGLLVPAPFYHDLSALPLTPEEKAALDAAQRTEANRTKNNAGYWEHMFRDANGNLHGIIDVDVPEYQERMGKSFKECSLLALPKFVDGTGEEWKDSILHVAVVTNPIVPAQDNFKPIESQEDALAIAMSMAMAIGDDENRPVLRELSISENIGEGIVSFHGSFKKDPGTEDVLEKFRDWVFKLKKGENVYLNNTIGLAMSANSEEKNTAPEIKPSCLLQKEDGTAMSLGDLTAVLPQLGITLPQDTNEQNFMDRLLTAATALVASKNLNNPTTGSGLTIIPGGVGMSHAIDINTPHGKNIAKQQRDKITQRITTLVERGVITAAYVKDTLNPMLEGVALSLTLDDEGNLGPTSIDPLLEALERLPSYLTGNGKKIDASKGSTKVGGVALAIGEEADEANIINEDNAEEIANNVLKNVGYGSRLKSNPQVIG